MYKAQILGALNDWNQHGKQKQNVIRGLAYDI